ncbi:mediator of RNA polymerase II transcription subunit 20 isoform X3 [Ornithorhynchus anatinus]|nr:mediator of RNA polymerase II transcription subunit 20 isoform X3 [Ornithorhynchus anatinus]XP_028925745.1 mediator of RNA polymerase II transcription subunit 20 isoform X3 [Ornithorhynchus anatinus]
MPVAEGKSVQQTVESLTKKLELLGAEKQGTFCVDCETYHTAASTMGSQGQTGKLMYVMHNSEFPLSCFALFESGPCLIADANFDVLMVKLRGFFQNAKASKIETRGTRYQLCDFLVKVGTVTMGPSARGISVEARRRLRPRRHHGPVHGTFQQNPQAAAGARGWDPIASGGPGTSRRERRRTAEEEEALHRPREQPEAGLWSLPPPPNREL